MGDEALPGMPNPWPLTVTRTGDGRAVAVHAGPMLLSAFAADDLEMRDLVICALTEGSRFQGRTVAAAFGIQPSQVSRIRTRYRERGARGLIHQMGRPPMLSPARLRQARLWAGQGLTHAEIGLRLGVSRSRISELLRQHGVLPAPDSLPGDAWPGDTDDTRPPRTRRGRRAGRTRRRWHTGRYRRSRRRAGPQRQPPGRRHGRHRRRRWGRRRGGRDLAGGGADRDRDGGAHTNMVCLC